ncbi:MAG TPA: tetratricopeptide repeat protein, partial [Opitutaceae bacterium]|nr:tetratricopeptide repeat protein [Opitutaceae bacterium]
MRSFAVPTSATILTKRQLALIAAALLALGPAVGVSRAATDLTTIRAQADQGDPEALNTLGNAYANGQGVAQSYPDAIRCYAQAAKVGFAPAQFNLAMLTELGRGVAENKAEAFQLYLKAAQQGFGPAQYNVGNMYANGVGVARDYFEAALWFRQAAQQGIPEALYNLGLAYELGRGVTKDEAQAQKFYRDSAEKGYVRARYNLALMLEDGRGSAPDEKAAAKYYRAAALQGYAPAQNNLGIMIAEGRGGLPVSLPEAYAWLALAAENGAKPTGRDLLAAKLDPTQLTEGKDRQARLRAEVAAAAGGKVPGPAKPAVVEAGEGQLSTALAEV